MLVVLVAAPLSAGEPRATRVCGLGVPGERPAGLDADRDGVPDSGDRCPGTGAGTRVGASGCADWEVPVRCRPQAEPLPPPAPARPPAAPACSGVPSGLPVDARGCLVVDRLVLEGVSFAPGSAALPAEAVEVLRAVAAALTASPRMRVEIGAHTDSTGPARRNQALSHQRAEAVKAFLVEAGIGVSRLSAAGFGETRPRDTNQTEAGRARNRRVELRVTGQ